MINSEKTTSILTKELETLTDTQLHDLFTLFYKLNHQHGNIITIEKFDEFLSSFDSNPFRLQVDQVFRVQLIQNLVNYTDDHMSLITAVMLLKQQFSIEEIIDNYYSNVDVFANNLFEQFHDVLIAQNINTAVTRKGPPFSLNDSPFILLFTKIPRPCMHSRLF